MWGKATLALRGAVWEAVWRIGTPAVALPLLSLAAAQLVLTAAIGAWGSREAAAGFATSAASWTLAAALVLDAAVAVLRALPFDQGPDGHLRMTPVGLRTVSALLLAVGYVVVALALVASLASRDRIEFRVAAGEEFTAAVEQAIARDPPRALSPGAFPTHFMVDEVRGGIAAGQPGAPSAIAVTFPGGTVRRASPLRPLWLGWGRLIRPVGSGHVFRYELTGADGAVLESAFAKLELEPPGKLDMIALEAPYRAYLELVPAPGARSGGASLMVQVYRGKQRVAGGTLRPGERLTFEGLTLGFPEWRPWVQLEMVRDPGLPIALLGAVIAGLGLALRWPWRRAEGRVDA